MLSIINCVFEWTNVLFPGWVVSWESIDRVDFSKLGDVHDFKLLKLDVSVEGTIVELSEVGHRVSFREVSLLAVVNSQVLVNLWLVHAGWIWNLLEVLVIRSAVQILNHVSEFPRLIQLLGSVRVKVTQAVEVFLSHSLAVGVIHFRVVE